MASKAQEHWRSQIVGLMETINTFYTTACIGQHLDLSLAPEEAVSEEIYLKIADMKSASTVECACRIGAIVASDDPLLIDKFALFGHNLGMSAQIANDILGIASASDIINRKITLPVIYALFQTERETRQQIEDTYFLNNKKLADISKIKDLLFSAGAVNYATIRMELFKQHSMDILTEIESTEINTTRLRPFLEYIR